MISTRPRSRTASIRSICPSTSGSGPPPSSSSAPWTRTRRPDCSTVQEMTRKVAIFYGPDFSSPSIAREQPFLTGLIEEYAAPAPPGGPANGASGSSPTADRSDQRGDRDLRAAAGGRRERHRRVRGDGVRASTSSPACSGGSTSSKRRVSLMRRMLSHTLDVIQKLVPGSEPTAPLFQDLRENAESMHFYADELLEDVNNLLSIQLALASHRTNEVVRVLTVFSVFFLPLTFIVGVYGMNFEFMPELRRALGLSGGAGRDGRRDRWRSTSGSGGGAGSGDDAALGCSCSCCGGRCALAGCWAAGEPASAVATRGRARICCPIPPSIGSGGRTGPSASGSPSWIPGGRAPRRAHRRRRAAGGRADRRGGPAAGAGARSGAERGGADGRRHPRLPCAQAAPRWGCCCPTVRARPLDAGRGRPATAAGWRAPEATVRRARPGADAGSLAGIRRQRGTSARLSDGADCSTRR